MAALPPGHAAALETIRDTLDGERVEWALTGSTSFVLQGLDLEPDDIDVQTTERGAHAIEDCFADAVTEPVSQSAGEAIQSHFGRLRIEGVVVEVMGALRKRDREGEWTTPVPIDRHREFVEFRGRPIPVLSLEYEATAYERLGRTERAARLRAHADLEG